MVEWCKKVGLAVTAFGLIAAIPGNANAADGCYSYDCDPCCDPCSISGFEAGVDFLYWKPCFDNNEFAAVESVSSETYNSIPTTVTGISYRDVCLDWEPGVRVRIAIPDCWCDWTLSGSYTWVNVRDSSSVAIAEGSSDVIRSPLLHGSWWGGLFPDLVNDWTIAKGSIDTTYQTWDVLFSYDITCNRCNVLTPFFGIEGLILNQERKASYYVTRGEDLESAQAKWESDYFGVGLKVGTDYTYTLFDCVKIFSRASGSIVVGEDCASAWQAINFGAASETIDRQAISYKDDDKCLIVPGWHLQLGMLYESCYCGVDFGIRFGWEFVKWLNVPGQRIFAGNEGSDIALSTSATSNHLGFHGLFAGAEVRF